MFSMLVPRYTTNSILEIDFGALAKQGIRGILVDFDNTLLAWCEETVSPEVRAWVKQAKSHGFEVCIVSNAEKERLRTEAAALDIPYVCQALKPGVSGLNKALQMLGLDSNEVTMVGDQMFTDVVAGNRLGLCTILVRPMILREQWWMKIVRYVEQALQKVLIPSTGHLHSGAGCLG